MPSGNLDVKFGAKPFRLQASAGHYQHQTIPIKIIAPAGSSSTSMSHGALFTLNGTGFGTRPDYNFGNYTWKGQRYIHYCWCDFSEVTPPTPSGNTNTDFINWKSAGLKGMYPTFYNPSGVFGAPRSFALDNAGVVAGGPSFGGFMWKRGPNLDATAGQRFGGLTLIISGTPAGVSTGSAGYPGEYVSCKYQCSGGFESTNPGNQKSYRRSYDFTPPTGTPIEYVWEVHNSNAGLANTSGGTWGSPTQTQGGGAGFFALHNQVDLVTQFSRMQLWTDSSGNMQQYCNQNAAVTWENSNIPTGVSVLSLFPSPWSGSSWSNSTTYNVNDLSTQCLTTFASESAVSAAYNQLFADIYFDFTPARIEITDGVKSEPQILLSWSSTQIKFLGNKGQLTSGSGTVNVYDNTNTIIQTYQVTIS